MMRCMSRRRWGGTRWSASTVRSSTRTPRMRMASTDTERRQDDSLRAAPDEHVRHLESRVAELERDRSHLVAIVDILQQAAVAPHFDDILQTIVHNLGRV